MMILLNRLSCISTLCIVGVLWVSMSPTTIGGVELNIKCTSEQCRIRGASINNTVDFNLDPCEDFYQYACAKFPDIHPLPNGKYLWDNYQILQNSTDIMMKDILSALIVHDEPSSVRKSKEMFASCMNTDSLDMRGITPLLNMMDHLGGWPVIDPNWSSDIGWNDLAAIIAEYGVPMLFEIVVRTNLFNANSTAIYLDKPSLAMPVPVYPLDRVDPLEDMERILSTNDKSDDSKYTQYLNKIALRLRDLMGTSSTDDDVITDMREVVNFMTRLFQARNAVENVEAHEMPPSGEVSFAQLQEWTDSLPPEIMKLNWVEFFNIIYSKTGIVITPNDHIIIYNTNALQRIMALFSDTKPRLKANFVISRLMAFLSPETDQFMRETASWFYTSQNFIPQDYERWRYCMHKVNDYPKIGMSMAIAYQFKLKYFDDEKLMKASEMIKDLREAFQELLEDNSWMDSKTREYAKRKADAMVVLQGFPDWLQNSTEVDMYYDKLLIDINDHFGNILRVRTFMQAKNLGSIAQGRDRYEWSQSPLIVNAFYNGLNNRITFPAGIMNDPFFNGRTIGALNYGRIGTIIGHEITHGFDSSGRLFGLDGSATNWWTNETTQAFLEKESCFIDQYNSYIIPEIQKRVNGTITKSENIADNGGLREAYRAFRRLRQRERLIANALLPGLEKFTPDQLFFLAYATMWCRVETATGLLSMTSDSHSPNRFRVIGTVSNMEEFSQAWGCYKGSPMNPEKKCVLW